MKKLLLVLFLFLTFQSFGQFTKPSGAVVIPTYSMFRTPQDSGVHIYQGSVNLYNSFLMKFDSVKLKGYATNFKLTSYKQIRDTLLNSGYATNWRLLHKLDSILGLAKLRNDSVNLSGYFTQYDALQKRDLNNHDSLSTLQERKYQSLTDTLMWGLGLSQTGHVVKVDTASASILSRQRAANTYTVKNDSSKLYKLKADSILNAGYYTNYKASQSSYLANDTWTRVYDYAGNLQNMWKVSKDNILTPGFRLGIDQLYTVADAGKVTIAQMPNVRSASGDTLQYNFKIGNVEMLKMRGIANGSGGLSDTTIIIPKLRLTNRATNGYYLQIVDAIGTVKAVPMSTGWQGTWNAATNTPTLANGTGTAGYWYRCLTAGTVNFGAGNITFAVGDEAHYNGTIWQNAGGSNTYNLQYMTKSITGGARLDSTTIKYNASTQLRVDTTIIASAKALTTHAALTTTAHGLGASAFHPDAYFKLAGDSVLNPGFVTNFKLRLYRPLNNHDSLSTLQEKNYSSLDGKPDLTVYKLNNDSVVNSGYYTNYKASIGTGFTLQNDQWLQAKDYAGNIFNLIKVSKDNMVTVPNLAVKSFYFVRNSGLNNLGWIPLNADGEGLEQGYELWAGNTRLMKLYGLGTAGGDIDSARAVFSNVYISQGAALNKIAMSEDSRGKVRWSDTKYLFNLVANRLLYASATNEMGQLPLGTANQPLLSGGANAAGWASYTLPASATSGKIIYGNGTNFLVSQASFPQASATARKIIVSDGTDWTASTETYAVPGTNGNLYSSDGTNWTSVSRGLGLTSTWTLAVDTASTSILSRQRAVKEYMPKSYPSAGIVISTGSAWGTSITNNSANWDKYNQWDGGNAGLVAATGRTSLGGTTIGQSMFTLTNPSTTTFPRFNADNTVTALSAADFRTAIGAGTSSTVGTVTSVAALTLGTTGTDLSSSVATGTTTPVITLNVPTASATNRGALGATDWGNFNTAYANRIATFTTTGTSGAATFSGNTLNIPQYQAAGSYEPAFSKNTGFNLNLGSTAGTVLEGRTFGTAANSAATDFEVPLTFSTGLNRTGNTITSTITQYTDALARGAVSFTAGSGEYNSTTGVFTIPTNTNQLTNGANFIASESDPTVNNATLTLATSGSGISGSQTFTANQGSNATFTVTSNATTTNTASTIVLRDGSGNVSLTGVFCTSDSTLKKNIRPLSKVDLYNASKIDFVKFLFKRDSANRLHFGVVAQDIEKLIPEIVSENEYGKKEVNYTEMYAIIIAQQKEEIKLLKEQNKDFEKRISKLERKNKWSAKQMIIK